MTRTVPTLLLTAVMGCALPAHASEPPAVDIQSVDTQSVERLLDMSEQLSEQLRDLADVAEELSGDPAIKRADGQVRRLIEDPEALRRAARDMERALEEADIFESLADIAIALSEQVEIVEGDDSLSLSLNGREMLSVDAEDEDRITLRAGGKRITIESD